MSKSINTRFIDTIYKKKVDATPIWIMRQAGRYLPEYKATRAQAGSFMKLCQTPHLACEVTLQPLRRFDLDASIIFSDILTIPDAMGLGLEFIEGEGPRFRNPLTTAQQIKKLFVPDLEKLRYTYDAIQLVTGELKHSLPLIGFAGSPWTLAAYMIEGQSKKGFPKLLDLMQTEPRLLHTLLNVLAETVAAHLNEQIRAGVQAVMIFDTWGGMLDTQNYQTFSLYYMQQALSLLLKKHAGKDIPTILFTKDGHEWIEQIANTQCNVIAVDWNIQLQEARKKVGSKVCLQGNMHPEILLQPAAIIQQEAKKILESYGNGPGHIFNLGHGITPNIPPENVKVLIDTVHEHSKQYHQT